MHTHAHTLSYVIIIYKFHLIPSVCVCVQVLVCVLRDVVADLKQVECETSESLQEAGVPRWLLHQMGAGSVVGGCLADTEAELSVRKREAAKMLQLTRSRIQQMREQELQQQRDKRESMYTYCRCVRLCRSVFILLQKNGQSSFIFNLRRLKGGKNFK